MPGQICRGMTGQLGAIIEIGDDSAVHSLLIDGVDAVFVRFSGVLDDQQSSGWEICGISSRHLAFSNMAIVTV